MSLLLGVSWSEWVWCCTLAVLSVHSVVVGGTCLTWLVGGARCTPAVTPAGPRIVNIPLWLAGTGRVVGSVVPCSCTGAAAAAAVAAGRSAAAGGGTGCSSFGPVVGVVVAAAIAIVVPAASSVSGPAAPVVSLLSSSVVLLLVEACPAFCVLPSLVRVWPPVLADSSQPAPRSTPRCHASLAGA